MFASKFHRKRVPTSVFSPSCAAARRLKMACWEVSQTLGMERSESMDGRKRTVQIKFRVTEAERDLILEKMKLVPTRNMEAYLRKMAIDGYIIQVDHSDIKAMTAEIQKIGVNVNQIAKRVNSTGSVYQEDIEEIKGVLNEIWRLQRLSLLMASAIRLITVSVKTWVAVYFTTTSSIQFFRIAFFLHPIPFGVLLSAAR